MIPQAADVPAKPPTNSVMLAWDASPDASVTGYVIYYGPKSRVYTNAVAVGNVTSATLTNLPWRTTLHFAATAHNAAGDESALSNEASYTVPAPPAPPLAIRVHTLELSWPVVAGITNTVQRSSDLTTWADLVAFPGTNGLARVLVTNDAAAVFYRLKI